nr:unnamed protein product [Callosobruchus analis]
MLLSRIAVQPNSRKVLIRVNLSAHLDEEVIKLRREDEIDFVCLIPNSTHLCQPLDVKVLSRLPNENEDINGDEIECTLIVFLERAALRIQPY